MSVQTIDVLRRLGFAEAPGGQGRVPGTLVYTFPGFALDALECMSMKTYHDVVLFTGLVATPRSLGLIEFEVPAVVESFEQGVAYLAYILDRKVGRRHADILDATWLELGRENAHLLPWERERAAREPRAGCFVDRDWMRLIRRELRAELATAEPEVLFQFGFDGEALRIRSGSFLVLAPARGEAWDEKYGIEAKALVELPNRFMSPSVRVAVYARSLVLGPNAYPLADVPEERKGAG